MLYLSFFNTFVVDNPGRLPYLRIRLDATWEKSNTIDGSIDSKISYITCPEFAEIEEGNRTKRLDGIWTRFE